MTFSLTYKPFGERSILIEWPAKIETHILTEILHFKEKIESKNIERISALRSAYHSLLVVYDKFEIGFEDEVNLLKKLYASNEALPKTTSYLWKIPVCYDISFGIDLEAISEEKSISKEAIVTYHSSPIYTIYFIGFLPGFLYLGGLHERLFTPRKVTPRLQIKIGAVAIGGNQTGIYPQESPGGWNVIGNSPINFFDSSKEQPCFAKAGDRLQFYQVSLKEHQNIKALVDAKVYQLESEVLDG
ncbi:5-oxoprolinase subunit PxpB [Flaviramulus aquimarinus]|uniref:5-oxoprolinase subunit PxpB n=1 Tax=Flaviramulus aquimarinus TaxID=1170456 RepID=A0ABP9FFS5_9FLAO